MKASTAARVLAEALRERYVTALWGRSWVRGPRICPEWCARDHRCSAQHGYPSGEHRSMPLSWRTGYGSLIVSRTETVGGEARIEVRITARLSDVPLAAEVQARLMAAGLDITTVAALAVGKEVPAIGHGR